MIKHLRTLLTIMVISIAPLAEAQVGKCKGKYLGNITAGTVHANYTTNWNQMTMENESKWQSIETSKGVYNFNGSDRGFNWAKNNGGLFKYHALMWGAQTAGWIQGKGSAEIQAAIPNYFKAVADHYNPMGGLKLIDVLNEPINTKVADNLKQALTAGYQAEPANANDKNNQYGWAIWCFQLARKHFPNATLLINEYNIEMNWNNCRAPYIAMSNAIKNAPNLTDGKKNLIDGIGLQAHGINNLTAANFKACLDEIWNKTGLPLHITEFDATADPNEAKQREDYSRLIPIAWEHPHVAGITLWGYIQGATWIPGNRQTGAGGTDSGIMYANGQDRPAMTWLRSYFASKTSLACCPAPAPFASCDGSNGPTVSITSPTTNTPFVLGTTINFAATATDADGTVSKVEFYNGTTKLGEDASSPYTYAWTNATVGTYNITAVATDNSGVKTTSEVVVVRVNVPQGPYSNNTPLAIPGVIEAEHYDVGGDGVAYHEANTNGNEGGATLRNDDVDIETTQDTKGAYNVGYILNGEWLEYTVKVANTAAYDLDLRVASDGATKTLHVEIDGVNVTGAITVPNTGGWQTWQTVTVKNLNLTAGQKVMRIAFDSDYMNLNYVEFKTSVISGIEEEAISNSQIYPNPFTEEGLRVVVAEKTDYKIFDILGQEIENGQLNATEPIGQSLAKGTYLLKLSNGNGVRVAKITKQ